MKEKKLEDLIIEQKINTSDLAFANLKVQSYF